jgi:hypothetical protein
MDGNFKNKLFNLIKTEIESDNDVKIINIVAAQNGIYR